MRLHLGSFAAAIFLVMFGFAASELPPPCIANLDEACGGPDKITCNSALYLPIAGRPMQRARRRRHLRQGAGFLHAGVAAGVRLQRQDLPQ